MRPRAASTASRAASHVLSRWRTLDAIDAASPPGGRRANVPPTPWHAWTDGAAASRAGRRRAPLYAINATRHEFRQQAELRRAAPRSPSPTRPLRLHVRILQPRPVVRRSERFRGRTRTHACFGWGSREARRPRARELFLIRQPQRDLTRGKRVKPRITGFSDCRFTNPALGKIIVPTITSAIV